VFSRKASTLLVPFLLMLLATTAAGCESIDPTEQSTSLAISNDLKRSVAISLCDDSACRSFDYTDDIAAGAIDEVNISDRGILTRWLVADRAGRTLGCLPLRLTGKYNGLEVRVTQMVRCPGEKPLVLRQGRKTSGVV